MTFLKKGCFFSRFNNFFRRQGNKCEPTPITTYSLPLTFDKLTRYRLSGGSASPFFSFIDNVSKMTYYCVYEHTHEKKNKCEY
jgi:hypothetical protein